MMGGRLFPKEGRRRYEAAKGSLQVRRTRTGFR